MKSAKLELQVHIDIELGEHSSTETDIRELEIYSSMELNRKYRIPEEKRRRLKLRNNY